MAGSADCRRVLSPSPVSNLQGSVRPTHRQCRCVLASAIAGVPYADEARPRIGPRADHVAPFANSHHPAMRGGVLSSNGAVSAVRARSLLRAVVSRYGTRPAIIVQGCAPRSIIMAAGSVTFSVQPGPAIIVVGLGCGEAQNVLPHSYSAHVASQAGPRCPPRRWKLCRGQPS